MNNHIFDIFNNFLLESELDLSSFYIQEFIKNEHDIICFLSEQEYIQSLELKEIHYKQYDYNIFYNIGLSDDQIILGFNHVFHSLHYVVELNYHDKFLTVCFNISRFIKSINYKYNKATKKKQKPPTFIYLMIDTTNNFYKIGRAKNPEYREQTLQSQKPTIELIDKWESNIKVEKKLHNHFDKKRIRGEWFKLTELDIKNIPNLIKKFENE